MKTFSFELHLPGAVAGANLTSMYFMSFDLSKCDILVCLGRRMIFLVQ